MKDLFTGELVRLTAESPEVLAKAMSRWYRNSELLRYADSEPAHLWSEKKHKEWTEKQQEKTGNNFRFAIRTLRDDALIGEISIHPIWQNADAWVGIGLGEPETWGRGYGTDAMRLILQYGFTELNLHRISLALHSYNVRALKSYQKVGFQLEGTVRSEILREGRRTDSYFMGILREDWLTQQGEKHE